MLRIAGLGDLKGLEATRLTGDRPAARLSTKKRSIRVGILNASPERPSAAADHGAERGAMLKDCRKGEAEGGQALNPEEDCALRLAFGRFATPEARAAGASVVRRYQHLGFGKWFLCNCQDSGGRPPILIPVLETYVRRYTDPPWPQRHRRGTGQPHGSRDSTPRAMHSGLHLAGRGRRGTRGSNGACGDHGLRRRDVPGTKADGA